MEQPRVVITFASSLSVAVTGPRQVTTTPVTSAGDGQPAQEERGRQISSTSAAPCWRCCHPSWRNAGPGIGPQHVTEPVALGAAHVGDPLPGRGQNLRREKVSADHMPGLGRPAVQQETVRVSGPSCFSRPHRAVTGNRGIPVATARTIIPVSERWIQEVNEHGDVGGLNQEGIRRTITYLPTDGGSHSGVTMAGRWAVSRCTDIRGRSRSPRRMAFNRPEQGMPSRMLPSIDTTCRPRRCYTYRNPVSCAVPRHHEALGLVRPGQGSQQVNLLEQTSLGEQAYSGNERGNRYY